MTLMTTWLSLLEFLKDAKILAVFFPLILLSLLKFGPFAGKTPSPALRILRLYGLVMGLLCLFVPTALLLQHYNARHYPYYRIWAMVPVLPLTAALLAGLVTALWTEGQKAEKGKKGRYFFAGLLGILFLLLCGNAGGSSPSEITYTGDRDELALAEETLTALTDPQSLIWAPKAPTVYLHRVQNPHRTVYGRDIWDSSLMGFQYDTCSEEQISLYETMQQMELQGISYYVGEGIEKGILCCNAAKDAGVSVILFIRPDASQDQALEKLADALSMTLTISDSPKSTSAGYYILTMDSPAE